MKNLFQKALLFGDIHLGNHNNEKQFNVDCYDFLKWMIEVAKEEKVDTIIFLGDWHHNRQSIHLMTLHYSMKCFDLLNSAGIKTYFIPGNHDEMYRDRRDIDSIIIGNNYENIIMINEPTKIGNCSFFPWLIKNEYKIVQKHAKQSKYIFGHFELPTFMMNAMIEMPEQHGNLKISDFSPYNCEVYTGHFHKRQRKENIWYIGNCFPHNYSDAWDDERGIVILEWDKEPIFKKWNNAPSYKTMSLSDFLENHNMITENSYVRITNDVGLISHELSILKNIIINAYNPRKLEITNQTENEIEEIKNNGSKIMTLDEIIIKGLKDVESNTIDKDILIDFFRELE